MSELRIRQAVPEDVPYMAEIDKVCFADPWSEESFRQEIEGNGLALYIIAEIDGIPAGYVGMWKILEEGHITNVAVLPEYRRKHVASIMLDVFFEVGENEGITSYTLEVRSSNEPAKKLYSGFGFKEAGIRKGYYQDNHEDAIIMWKNESDN